MQLPLTINDLDRFKENLTLQESWVDTVERYTRESHRDSRLRIVVAQGDRYFLLNPFSQLSPQNPPDGEENLYFFISDETLKRFGEEGVASTTLPVNDRKSVLQMIAASTGATALLRELTAASPHYARMLDGLLPLIAGPMGGLAHYYVSCKTLEKITGRALNTVEKKLLKREAAGVTFSFVASYAGSVAGMEAAKLLLLMLNIFPQAAVMHLALAVGSSLGMATFSLISDLLKEKSLHGRIVSTPSQILGRFLGNFVFGMAFYGLSLIPFSGVFGSAVPFALERAVNMAFSLIGIAISAFVATRVFAAVKHSSNTISFSQITSAWKSIFSSLLHKKPVASVILNQPLPAPAEGEALDAVDDMPIADEETSTPFDDTASVSSYWDGAKLS
jgi:hypothetical protein